MAKRKINNSNNDGTSHEISESPKIFEKQLLLPTIYKLNLSFGKKVVIGFEEQKDGDLYPVIRLIGKDFIGLSFKADAWYNFQKEFNTISEYFDSEDAVANEMRDQQFVKQDFSLLFTISYGQRCIIIDRLQNCDEEEEEDESKKKKRKYSPRAIIMQKTTFDNLREICVCINERLRRLEAIAECVNYCQHLLIKQLHIEIRKNDLKMDLCTVIQFIKNVRNILEKQTYDELNAKYSLFTEQEFHIIFLELTTIYRASIAQKIIK